MLLLVVFRALLAPLVTLLPAALALAISQPVIAEATKIGVDVSFITQILLIVLILGAGTDYGLFLVFRVREELRRGHEPKEAVVRALAGSANQSPSRPPRSSPPCSAWCWPLSACTRV